MNRSPQTRVAFSILIAFALPLAAALIGCGSSPGEPESKMTSFTSTESKADTAQLFTVPKEQMAHLQIVPAEKSPLLRTLRLTSPDYSAARSAYIKAREAFALSAKLYARAQDLFAHGAISEADLQQAEASHNQAHADMESSADMLRALGVKDPDSLIKNAARPTSESPVLA